MLNQRGSGLAVPIWDAFIRWSVSVYSKDLFITPLPRRNKARACLSRRALEMAQPLRIQRSIHIFQYVEIVNAPAEGAGRRGLAAPLGAVLWLLFLACESLFQLNPTGSSA